MPVIPYVTAPETQVRGPFPLRCCAHCRRGQVPGQFPCQYGGNCTCHGKHVRLDEVEHEREEAKKGTSDE